MRFRQVRTETQGVAVAVKKAPAKKSAAKKSAAKKSVTKKSSIKKSATKKAPAKKSVAKKAPAKKLVAKKSVAKKTAAKKPVTKSVLRKREQASARLSQLRVYCSASSSFFYFACPSRGSKHYSYASACPYSCASAYFGKEARCF